MCAAIVKHYNKINTSVLLSKIKHVCVDPIDMVEGVCNGF